MNTVIGLPGGPTNIFDSMASAPPRLYALWTRPSVVSKRLPRPIRLNAAVSILDGDRALSYDVVYITEGIPYELETFTELGVVADDPDIQDNGRVLLPKTQEKPVVHAREFPVNNAAVTFP
jgi:hypothetical protein